MADIRSTYIHERQVKCFINRHELERVVREHALRQAGYDPEAKSLTVKVTFEDETQGSPSYTVGTKARIDITEALLADPQMPVSAQQGEEVLRAALKSKGDEMLALIDSFGSTDGNERVRDEIKDTVAHAVALLSYAPHLDR
jgi:hypothetical protein